jgi:acyl dehydratase
MSVDRFPIEAGHVLAFARAIGDDNPVYRDPDSPAAQAAGGLLAPPTFTQASAQWDPDYPLRPKPGQKWYGSAAEAGTMPAGSGGLHAEQHFTYHRPVLVGDVLSARRGDTDETWSKSGRSGRLEFTAYTTEFRDAAGELVVTVRTVSVQRFPHEGKDA